MAKTSEGLQKNGCHQTGQRDDGQGALLEDWLVARKNKRWNLVTIILPIVIAILLALMKTAMKVKKALSGF